MKNHPFFASIDWERLKRREGTGPIVGKRERVEAKIQDVKDENAAYLLQSMENFVLNKESYSVGMRRGSDG